MLGQEDFQTLAGRTVVGNDGQKIGKIDQMYADREDGHPTFVTVNTGMFGGKANFVPLDEARVDDDDLVVPYPKDLVKDAPGVDPDGEITPEEEDRLYMHYGLTGPHARTTTEGMSTGDDLSATGAGTYASGTAGTGTTTGREPVGRDVSGPTTDDAMTRSEERLSVGKEQVETGRARLRKYVVTENVTQTVPVSREEVRVEREPITDANIGQATSGPGLSEEEHEITLTEERPVVDKETVPVERVRLDKETVTDQREVSEQVRKEQIDTEGGESTSGVYPDGGTTSATEERTR